MLHRSGPRFLESLEWFGILGYAILVGPLRVLFSRMVYGPAMAGISFSQEFMDRTIGMMNKRMSIQQLRWIAPPDSPSEEEARKAEAKGNQEMKLYEKVVLPPTSGENGVNVVWIGDRNLKASDCDVIWLYAHGGGFNLFHTGMMVPFFTQVHKEVTQARGFVKFKILSVDYSLAPEKTYPYQLHQLQRAYYDYLIKELGVDAKKVVLGGDSAGGNFVSSLPLFLMKTPSIPLPGKVVSISTWINLVHEAPSMHKPENWIDQLDKPTLDNVGANYLLGDIDHKNLSPELTEKYKTLLADPCVSPINASQEQLAKLPPTIFFIGDHEVLRDDCEAFYAKLEAAAPGKHTLIVGKSKVHDYIVQQFGQPDGDSTVGKEMIDFMIGSK